MNKQPAEKATISLDGTLQLHSIFQTIQGEGPFAGHPAVFIRLAGCNLQCPQCDTDYTSDRVVVTLHQVIEAVARHSFKGLVVITGGEPFRQNITPLCRLLIDEGYFVQIETNGTLSPSYTILDICSFDTSKKKGVYIVCSPKTGRVNAMLQGVICAYKYVLTDGYIDRKDGLPTQVLDHPTRLFGVARPHVGYDGPVYVQPADLQNAIDNQWNLKATIRSCIDHGYILQLQLHKLIGME